MKSVCGFIFICVCQATQVQIKHRESVTLVAVVLFSSEQRGENETNLRVLCIFGLYRKLQVVSQV